MARKTRVSRLLLRWSLAAALGAAATPEASAADTTAKTEADTETFRVVGVATNDSLKLRTRPHPTADVLADVPPDARGLRTTGATQAVGRGLWRELLVGGQRGWVNARFLEREAPARREASAPREAPVPPREPAAGPAPGQFFAEGLACGNDRPSWQLIVKRDGTVGKTLGVAPAPSSGARATPAEPLGARTDAWRISVQDASGARLMSLLLEQGECQTTGTARYKYSISAQITGGATLFGCCNLVSPR